MNPRPSRPIDLLDVLLYEVDPEHYEDNAQRLERWREASKADRKRYAEWKRR